MLFPYRLKLKRRAANSLFTFSVFWWILLLQCYQNIVEETMQKLWFLPETEYNWKGKRKKENTSGNTRLIFMSKNCLTENRHWTCDNEIFRQNIHIRKEKCLKKQNQIQSVVAACSSSHCKCTGQAESADNSWKKAENSWKTAEISCKSWHQLTPVKYFNCTRLHLYSPSFVSFK